MTEENVKEQKWEEVNKVKLKTKQIWSKYQKENKYSTEELVLINYFRKFFLAGWEGMLRRGCRRNSLRARRRLKTYTLWNYGRDNREAYRGGNNTKTVLLHSEEGLCSSSLRRWGGVYLNYRSRGDNLYYVIWEVGVFALRPSQERTYEKSRTPASSGSAIIFCRIFWYLSWVGLVWKE